MNWSKRREAIKLSGIILWLIFTVAFALWWFRFSLEQISLLTSLQPEQLEHWSRQRRMIFWEGTSWIVLLSLGGGALIALVQKERLRIARIREFFASFSHEIKTSLASLRLQAEALKDENPEPSSPILTRLIGDTVRLQLQLENSLFVASQDSLQLFIQSLSLRQLLERMREQWPSLNIQLTRECRVQADERAMRTILSNLLQNAILHGGASQVVITAEALRDDQLAISIVDNGKGFQGSRLQLGTLFHRPESTSGSGLGLHICKLLLHKMNGRLELAPIESGFQARLTLHGALS